MRHALRPTYRWHIKSRHCPGVAHQQNPQHIGHSKEVASAAQNLTSVQLASSRSCRVKKGDAEAKTEVEPLGIVWSIKTRPRMPHAKILSETHCIMKNNMYQCIIRKG